MIPLLIDCCRHKGRRRWESDRDTSTHLHPAGWDNIPYEKGKRCVPVGVSPYQISVLLIAKWKSSFYFGQKITALWHWREGRKMVCQRKNRPKYPADLIKSVILPRIIYNYSCHKLEKILWAQFRKNPSTAFSTDMLIDAAYSVTSAKLQSHVFFCSW